MIRLAREKVEITHTITVPELIWTVASLIGLIFNGIIFCRLVGEYKVIRKKQASNGKYINLLYEFANLNLFIYGTWAFIQLVFAAVGVVSMTEPSPKGQEVTSIQEAISVSFILISVLLAWVAIHNESTRREISKGLTPH